MDFRSEHLHKEPLAHLPTALRPSLPVQHRVFHQAEKQLTPFTRLRYGFVRRKGWFKILSVLVFIGRAQVLDSLPPDPVRIEAYLEKYREGTKDLGMTIIDFTKSSP